MQSDWHRYNLKRRVASLPPISSEIFTEKVLANQATAAATAAKAQFEKLCPACNKTYFSENAFRNHIGSQKHRQRVAEMQADGHDGDAAKEDETNSVMSSAFSLGDPVDTSSTVTEESLAEQEFSQVVNGIKKTSITGESPVSRRPSRPHHSSFQDKPAHPLSPTSDEVNEQASKAAETEDDPANLQSCLFCNTESKDLPSNIAHMQSKHGLFIPEQDYLVDLEGLIHWLHDRVAVLHECLYCGIVRHSTTGIQTHMRDKGHCMIAFESEEQMLEVGQFYDFRSSYSDNESNDGSDTDTEPHIPQKPRLGASRPSQTIDVNGDGMETTGEDEEWEDEDAEESDDTEDGGAALNGEAPAKKHKHKRREPNAPVYHDEEGLHLPSGRLAGHRSLARYFRQNLHSYPTPAERLTQRSITDSTTQNDDDNTSTNTNTALTPTGPRGRPENAVISRANGGLGMLGVSAAKKEEVSKKEKADRKRVQRAEKRYQWGNEKRANHQAHFRDPLLQ
ncbi:MAG: hypothetical protein Q9162_004673 [Coniocarpon cinnabarinum]